MKKHNERKFVTNEQSTNQQANQQTPPIAIPPG